MVLLQAVNGVNNEWSTQNFFRWVISLVGLRRSFLTFDYRSICSPATSFVGSRKYLHLWISLDSLLKVRSVFLIQDRDDCIHKEYLQLSVLFVMSALTYCFSDKMFPLLFSLWFRVVTRRILLLFWSIITFSKITLLSVFLF